MTTIPSSSNTEYIGTTDYKKLEFNLRNLKSILDDKELKAQTSRKLRYAEVDIEAEREAGRIAPDELYIPQHIIDSNIRKEQSSYVQYITQSPRAVILEDLDDNTVDLSPLEKDLTKKLRYDGWQIPAYANIDAFQSYGYSIMETVYDESTPGNVSREVVQYGDFAFISDTRNLQTVEFVARTYHYTKTKLMDLCDASKYPEDSEDVWSKEQIEKILGNNAAQPTNDTDGITLDSSVDKSLFKVQKVMFRVNGIVNVAWTCIGICDDWLRNPRPLYIGRRKMVEPQTKMPGMLQGLLNTVRQAITGTPQSEMDYETEYPYFLYPYLISENDTIDQLKGRVFLDQDTQEAVSSLISSTVTQSRRAAGLYFSVEENDPNNDVLQQKNVFFRQGALISSKVKSFSLNAPDPSIFSAIQSLVSMNLQETSQVNFAERNLQRDSRKTAAAIRAAESTKQELSTVQVVLYSIALKEQYTYECSIIKSRVQAGLIKVSPTIRPLYDRNFSVKPSGDVDVIERNKMIDTMMGAWSIIGTTAAAPYFLNDLLEKLFPDNAPKYIKAMQDAIAQQQSVQTQQQQQIMQGMLQLAQGIVSLAKHKEFFSEIGVIHAYPTLQMTADKLKEMMKQFEQAQKQTTTQ